MRVFGHYCNRREHRNAALAHSDDVSAGAQYFDKSDEVTDEVVEVEPAISHTDIASVMPVGNVDVVAASAVLQMLCSRNSANGTSNPLNWFKFEAGVETNAIMTEGILSRAELNQRKQIGMFGK
jgi:hypothetical protein